MGNDPLREDRAGAEPARADRISEWAVLGEWLASPPPLLHKVDLEVLQERLTFMGRARASLAAAEAEVVAEISRREGDAAAEETLRRTQKRSRAGARKAVKIAAQLEWSPRVAGKLAEGAITPEAAGLILDAAGETPVDHGTLLDAAESEPDDQFRRTLKEHINERTSEQELEQRRAAQRRRRRASISEQGDGMFHLFAQLDPLTGAKVQAALIAKSDQLFRSEDPKDRPTPPQRFADALAELVCTSDGAGAPPGVELLVLADYDQVHDAITNARLADGTRLTEAETLAIACDAKILPGIFNKHTGNPLLGRSQRKVSPRHRKRLVARDGGCIGCGASEKICEVHHLDHWAHGGETTLENTCLLCWRCHHIRVHLHGEEITRRPGGRLTLGPPTDASDTEPSSLPPRTTTTEPTPTKPLRGPGRTPTPDSPPGRANNLPYRPPSPAGAETRSRPSPDREARGAGRRPSRRGSRVGGVPERSSAGRPVNEQRWAPVPMLRGRAPPTRSPVPPHGCGPGSRPGGRMAALSIPVMIWLRRRVASPDTARDARLLARLLVVAGAGALALAVSPIFAVALAGWTVLDVAGETTYPLAGAMANREASSGVRATVISFLGQAEALGQVLGGVALGLVAQFVSLPIALATAAGLLAAAAIPVAVIGRARPARAR